MKTRLVLLLLLVFGIGWVVGQVGPAGRERARTGAQAGPRAPAVPPLPPLPATLGEEEKRDIEVFRRASASVVNITSIAFQRDFFSLNIYKVPQGSGTGFVWDTKGHIVTNFHVIGRGDRFSVTLSDQSDWDAEVVGTAPEKDLAVLRIDAPRELLVPLAIGRSSDLIVGQRVLAVGNPFGLDQTLTTGIVSALGREIESPSGRTIRDVIQTDAAINPGNSGGPLLNSAGRLIGVNTMIVSPSGAYAGIGFAVPVDTVSRMIPQVIEHGRALLPGIDAVFLSDAYARRLDLDGVIVQEVAPGGVADRAGVQGIRMTRRRFLLGDVIVAIDGKPTSTVDDLLYAMEAAGVGRKVRLTILRGSDTREVTVELVAR